MAFVSCDANEEAALSSSHLQSMTGVSALNLTTKHPLGLYSFHLPHSTLRLPLVLILRRFALLSLLGLLAQMLHDDTVLKVL